MLATIRDKCRVGIVHQVKHHFREEQLSINPGVDPGCNQRCKDTHLAYLNLAQSPIVLSPNPCTVLARLLLGTLVYPQHRPLLKLGVLFDFVLDFSYQSWP